ncbi:hypothetical protein BO78DRAFT_400188 [Aspergillus sclerotiicarbonarius CBS 121057]|uniref:Uncharacterized protein n=1 Tax=Aspergillus sclerotiicarbonarius (strain CBS 121057 / IBT 28362) TaxID=1448318 RepID=A0A319EQ65_ASPSB|nr:hypothetical protein BO78DRAFT_400188 [Aspergillus sclerotiicarbonarius CBS 121057]
MWFLTHDFDTRKDGPIQLGTVLEKPVRPKDILASPGNGLPDDLVLPSKRSFIEGYHTHEYTRGQKAPEGIRVWNAFLDMMRDGTEEELIVDIKRGFGKVDHEVWTFDGELDDQCLKDILLVPKVKAYMKSIGKSVFVVTSLRITNTPLILGMRSNPDVSDQASAPANEPTASVPNTAEAEGDAQPTDTAEPTATVPNTAEAEGDAQPTDTAEPSYGMCGLPPGIVFAFRVHIIRDHGSDIECEEVNPCRLPKP